MKEKLLVLTAMILLAVALYTLFRQENDGPRFIIEVDYRDTSPFFRTFAADFTEHFSSWWRKRGKEEFGGLESPLYIGEESSFFVVYLKTDSGVKLIWQARIPFLQKEVDILARTAVNQTAEFLREYFRQRYV